ncbi:MAG: nuclear transport factor 2 family protein [Spirochaetales bacterium]|nr:nuclear transport factor 2 family protein [Spirochaetales bacterium]
MADDYAINGERVTLNVDTIRALWSKTYNTAGKPDWAHIFPYYHEDIRFQDSVQRVDGKADFTAMCNRLTRRCQQLNMEILSVAKADDGFFLQWIMVMIFKKSPSTPVYGCTKLTIDSNGMIVEQRDYYDLWGDIFNGIPGFRRMYRKFMKRFFG